MLSLLNFMSLCFEAMEDLALLMQANARMNDGKELIEVSLDDL